ncbi:hypothetical protein PVA44_07580 (plasmid) [Entomospira nematocerorum]|uniref:Uncharacterized protein n=1 Tax=Entomospira nematocerorum TaxID=2719987 RepID=A0A968GEU4_9SPIO|nr:hypothetical protein [Entomospira nematocera]NIZ47772.1 hypothetical protein [Entomospira nematocera]WDI34726.1 hypothetical protein PVA44_07580 [Entomospira nematocera]
MSSIPNSNRASGNFIEHVGGLRIPPTLEQKVLILGTSDSLGEGISYLEPHRMYTIPQVRRTFGEQSQLTDFLIFAIQRYPDVACYGVAIEPITTSTPIPTDAAEGEGEKNTKALKRNVRSTPDYMALFTRLFENLGDTFYTKMSLPFFDIEAVKTLIALSQDRFSPEIHRPITHFVPSNLAFEQQLELPKQCNSPFINFIYLEGAPEEELGKLATASMLACANVDVSRLGLPYKTTPIQGIAYRRGENYRYRESDLLVRAGSSWLEENNAGELLLGDVCSTYREKDGFADETWFFSETFSNYQSKVFDMTYLLKSRYSQVIFVPNNSPTMRKDVVKPVDVKMAFVGLINQWELNALSVNSKEIIASLEVRFNAQNPARIDISLVDQMSVGGRIFTVSFSHGFNTNEN